MLNGVIGGNIPGKTIVIPEHNVGQVRGKVQDMNACAISI